jgi:hypothetical protein
VRYPEPPAQIHKIFQLSARKPGNFSTNKKQNGNQEIERNRDIWSDKERIPAVN